MFKKFLFIATIFIAVLSTKSIEAQAGVITGEKALGGISFLMNKCLAETKEIPYPEQVELLAEVMFHENYSNGEQVMYYTGAVVMNRVKRGWADGTIKGVLYQEGQYSTTEEFFTKSIPHSVYELALDIIKNGTPDVPSNVVYQATFEQGSKVWKKVPAKSNDNGFEYFCFE